MLQHTTNAQQMMGAQTSSESIACSNNVICCEILLNHAGSTYAVAARLPLLVGSESQIERHGCNSILEAHGSGQSEASRHLSDEHVFGRLGTFATFT